MAKPPESTKISLRQKLASRAAERWPQLAGITSAGTASSPTSAASSPTAPPAPDAAALRRLRHHLGLCHLPGQPRRLREVRPAQRLPAGTPQEALDCACGLYLGDHTAWLTQPPPTN